MLAEDEKTKKDFSFQAGAILYGLASAAQISELAHAYGELLSVASAEGSLDRPIVVAAVAFASKLSYVLWHIEINPHEKGVNLGLWVADLIVCTGSAIVNSLLIHGARTVASKTF